MPLTSPWRTAYGSDKQIGSVLVRMICDDLCGWGETTPLQYPTYSAEWSGGVFATLRDVLAPLVIGKEISSAQALQDKLACVRGNQFAKAGLDLAWWDIYAKTRNEPLWKVIGGTGNTIEVGADFGVMDSLDILLSEIDVAVKAGFKRVKLKYCPSWGLEMVDAVRRAFPKAVFHIDCNGAFCLDDLPMFEKLQEYNLAMIEQPLAYDDLIEHAELQRRIVTPVCLDESITSPDKARKAVQIQACKWINIKPGRVGGLTNALKIHDICHEAHVPCWVGGMLESAIGASYAKALATMPNIKYPSDIMPSNRFYQKDLSVPETVLSGPSQMTVSMEPGVGAEPDHQRLAEWTVEKAKLQASVT